MEESTKKTYIATPDVQKKRVADYAHLKDMIQLKGTKFPHFTGGETGQRSFLENIDQSEKVINGFTLTREDQGKESWQSNLLDNVARSKLRAIAAGVGLKVPDARFTAVNKSGLRSPYRAEVFKQLTKQSFKINTNPVIDNFQEVWQRLSHGVTFTYEGYHTGGAKRKVVESFDSNTGEVKYKEEYVKFDGKPVSILLNPQEFYWGDMFKDKVTEQPRLAWLQHYTKNQLETEFSKYPNYKYVKDSSGVKEGNLQETTYFSAWSQRVESKDDYEVFRYYSIDEDVYRIWVNGVLLLDAPMLWGHKEKYYPFAKTILEPYANVNFFVGMPFGQMVEAYQDGKNTILNSIIDKLYRSMDPRMLVGLQNKDLFDVQNDITEQDNVMYVPDISAVRAEPIAGVTNSELAMLQVMDRGLDTVSISSTSSGVPKANVTATADQLAAQRAAEIKSNLYIYSEDLWMQKLRLRMETILTHFMKDVTSRADLKDQIIYIDDYTMSDGVRGTLGIHIAKNKNDQLSVQEIDAREEMAREQGNELQLISLPYDYLDEWEYGCELVAGTLDQQNRAKDEADLDSLIQWATAYYPEFIVSNKDQFLEEKLKLRGKHIEDYNPPAPPPDPMAMMAAQGEQPTATAGAPAGAPAQPSVLGLPQ